MFVKSSRLLVLWIVAAVLLLAACSTNAGIFEAYISADGVTVELSVNTCNADLSTEVIESESTAEVTVIAENDTTDDCADVITITVNEALGDRSLIDGSTGEVLRVSPAVH